jgi:hypothetical protein
VSLASASLAYLCLSRGFDARNEAAALRAPPSLAEFARG